ncbi:glycoside hydrolase family 43 protein [Jaapia argillacea MUCL 33604]|uniref:Glycoside hydrolase family 43 protein n=1 Tax=Jaapia argillacea MUCL 33604 TaxID=933084 RepID=A0A067PAK3_9AGAM|nr:glycoside hydrolase family 43 protein [Jaapia argillacea MUCL 33604]
MPLLLQVLAVVVLCFGTLVSSATTPSPYKNPIIPGFNPDPSCTRVDDRYFCVTSSFNTFPGIPVYTSRDLIQWEQIGNVFSRPEQLPMMAQEFGFTSGIWASTIRYNDGTFYITTTLVWDKLAQGDPSRWDNLIFTNTDIFANNGNGWSDPIHFSPGFQGYDVSLFWDDDGKTYVQGSHAWRVQPGIWQYEIDLTNGSIWNPEVLWTGTGGIAPEGPHVYKRDGFYYLLIAEGGTGLNHMVTMARSNGSIHGPYVPYENNPVLTNANTTEYLQTVGHSDIFDDTEGNFWAVALATRNATVNYPMGRETVLVPVVWETGQYPLFNPIDPGRVTVNMTGPLPLSLPPLQPPDGAVLSGQDQVITFSPDTPLPRQLVYLRLPDASKYTLAPPSSPDSLCLYGSLANLTGPDGISGTSTWLGRRQQHVQFVAEADMQFDPQVVGEEAGVTVFLQQLQHFDLGVVALGSNGERYVRLRTQTANATNNDMTDPLSSPGMVQLPKGVDKVTLRVEAVNASTYAFSYAEYGSSSYQIVGYGAASEVSGGFTGTIVGIYATGDGKDATVPACFSRFAYYGNQTVY